VTDAEEQNLIAALRSAGHREPGVPATPVSQTTRRGRAARRGRTVVAATGGATVVAGIVTAAIALPPVLIAEAPRPAPAAPSTESTPSHQPTPEPDLPTSPREQGAANRQAVLDALPEGFVEISVENVDEAMGMAGLALAKEAPATDGLPDGMSGGVSLHTFPAHEFDLLRSGWCDRLVEQGTTVTACSDHPVGQAIVKTQEGSRPAGGVGGAWESIRTTYEQPDGDAVVLDLHAWEDDRRTTPDRQAAARAWLKHTHEQIVRVVLDPAIQPPARFDVRNEVG